jgi:hypothetical protein
VRPNKKIDTTPVRRCCSTCWGQAPGSPTSAGHPDLLRNLTMEVPSGQSIASAMSLPPLAPGDLSDLQPLSLHNRTPLWFYVLREAQVTADGEHLDRWAGASSPSSSTA